IAGSDGPAAYAIEAVAAVAAMGVALMTRRRDPALALAAACAGSLVAFPYHQAADSVVLLAAAWLTLRRPAPGWYWGVVGGLWITAFLAGPWGSRPLMTGALVLLLALVARAAVDRRQETGGSTVKWARAGGDQRLPSAPTTTIASSCSPGVTPDSLSTVSKPSSRPAEGPSSP